MSAENIPPDRIQEELKTHETDFKRRKWRRLGYIILYSLSEAYIVDARQHRPFKKINQDRNPDDETQVIY